MKTAPILDPVADSCTMGYANAASCAPSLVELDRLWVAINERTAAYCIRRGMGQSVLDIEHRIIEALDLLQAEYTRAFEAAHAEHVEHRQQILESLCGYPLSRFDTIDNVDSLLTDIALFVKQTGDRRPRELLDDDHREHLTELLKADRFHVAAAQAFYDALNAALAAAETREEVISEMLFGPLWTRDPPYTTAPDIYRSGE